MLEVILLKKQRKGFLGNGVHLWYMIKSHSQHKVTNICIISLYIQIPNDHQSDISAIFAVLSNDAGMINHSQNYKKM